MKLSRFLRPVSKRSAKRFSRSVNAGRLSTMEALEDRQLMSLTIELRTASGGTSASVSSVGQVVQLQAWAVVTGTGPGINDGFQEVDGSFLSTETSSANSVAGNLGSPDLTPDYTANGSQLGTIQDLNADGNKDIGSNNNSDIAGFFNARAGGIEQDGTVSGDSQSFEFGTFNYTVTSLHSGAATDVNFRLRNGIPSGAFDAIWVEDYTATSGHAYNDQTGDLIIGAPVVISASNVKPPSGVISGAITKKSTTGTSSAFAGVTVDLDNSSNTTVIASTTTASNGSYSFTGLAAGSYALHEVVPGGYVQTSPSSSPVIINLSSNTDTDTENFVDTAVAVKPASIGGTVYKVVSGSTSDFSGVTVALSTSAGPVASTTTSSGGAYSFTGLSAGTYDITETVPTGYTRTSPSSSPTVVTVTAGQNATGENFTDTASTVTTTGSIAGAISKVVSGVTSGFAGVTVDLDKSNVFVTSTITNSTGTYSFTGLPGGTYEISEVVPTGYTRTSPATSPISVTLASGQNATGENFIDTAASTTSTGSISGTVYSDANSNGKFDSTELGIPNVTVYVDLKNDGKDDSGDPTTSTSASGAYTFSGLAPGSYTVRQVLLSGDKFTSPSSGSLSVSVASGAKVTGENFGNTGPITLSGIVFDDINGNGKQDSGEAGLSGWVVYVDLNKDGKFEANENNKTTLSNGTFEFVSLTAGTYEIRIAPKSGYSETLPTSGYYTVTLAPGDPISISFGEMPTAKTSSGNGAVTLSGNVFSDVNSNGTKDSSETGLSGWVVYADLNDSGKFVASDNNKTTDSSGNFEFVSLQPGTYIIRVVPETGYTETAPAAGFYTVSLQAGDPVSIPFGEHAA